MNHCRSQASAELWQRSCMSWQRRTRPCMSWTVVRDVIKLFRIVNDSHSKMFNVSLIDLKRDRSSLRIISPTPARPVSCCNSISRWWGRLELDMTQTACCNSEIYYSAYSGECVCDSSASGMLMAVLSGIISKCYLCSDCVDALTFLYTHPNNRLNN